VDLEKKECNMEYLIWVDKGQSKTVVLMCIIDYRKKYFDSGRSPILKLAEYVGGEDKIDQTLEDILCKGLNMVEATSFLCAGVKCRLRLGYMLLDHSAGCNLYSIRGVK